MNLNQLSISISADEIAKSVRTAIARAQTAQAKMPPELADLAVEIKDQYLVISTKMKMGFVPVTISGKLKLHPSADANGIVITLAKISAGLISSEAIAAQLLGQLGRTLTGVPGCSVVGNDVTITKEVLAAKFPWLSVPGKITRFGITDDILEIAIG